MSTNNITLWQVGFTTKAQKQATALPRMFYEALDLLRAELEIVGPVLPHWHHYGKLKGKKGEYHHCHLNKGKPRYVVVWQVVNGMVRVIDICFAGTHGKVDYKSFK